MVVTRGRERNTRGRKNDRKLVTSGPLIADQGRKHGEADGRFSMSFLLLATLFTLASIVIRDKDTIS